MKKIQTKSVDKEARLADIVLVLALFVADRKDPAAAGILIEILTAFVQLRGHNFCRVFNVNIAG